MLTIKYLNFPINLAGSNIFWQIGLALIPLSDLGRIPQMLSQLYLVEKEKGKKRPNPFKFGVKKKILSEDEQMVKKTL